MENSIFFMLPAPVGECVSYSLLLLAAAKWMAVDDRKVMDSLLWFAVTAAAAVPAGIYMFARMT